MKIIIKEDPSVAETEITVVCKRLAPALEDVIERLRLCEQIVTGSRDGETYFFPAGEILYFESVDRRVFFYTINGEYETKSTLAELESSLSGTSFSRVSKQTIANLDKIRSVRRERNSVLTATLTNGERIVISRHYLNEIMRKLGVE